MHVQQRTGILFSMLQSIYIYSAVISLLCSNAFSVFQKSVEIVEEIRAVPTDDSQPWHIGDIHFHTNNETVIDLSNTPLPGNLAIVTYIDEQIATSITPLLLSAKDGHDGPYILNTNEGDRFCITMENGKIVRTKLSSGAGSQQILTKIPAVPEILMTSSEVLALETHRLDSQLLVVSDLEGNLDHLLEFLQFHHVIDNNYDWSWGENQVLFNGDSVDRGNQVTELLWFVRKLQQQARKEGGNVHFVLGNHEAMLLAGDIRYAHPKYKFVAARAGIPYHDLLGEHTVLGNWIRSQPSVIQIGAYLFVHAGYSPELNGLKLTKKEINSSIRTALGPPAWGDRTDLRLSLIWHKKGPLWYRGYFKKHENEYGPKPTDEQLNAILQRHGAKAIVVGHTVTGTIGWLDGDRRLIGTDVRWDTRGEGQGLHIEGDAVHRWTTKESGLKLEIVSTSN